MTSSQVPANLRALGEPLRHGAATLAQVMAPTAQVIRVKAPKKRRKTVKSCSSWQGEILKLPVSSL